MNTQTKTIIISLLLFFNANAQDGVTRFFVDGDVVGGNVNGTSWANAWDGINDIDFTALTAGDTVYISGGSDSLVYTMTSQWEANPNISFATSIVICPSWESGYNGNVVFTNSEIDQRQILGIRGLSGIKMTGIIFRDTRTSGTGVILAGDVSNPTYPNTGRIHLDDIHIISNGATGLVNFEAIDITLSNSILEYLLNDKINEADPLTLTYAEGTVLYENNTIIQRNTNNETDAHRDIMQFNFDSGLGNSIDIIIRNNILIQDGATGTNWNAIIYNSISAIDTINWYIYNNILVSNTTASSVGGIFIYNSLDGSGGTQSSNYWIFNNTIIQNDNGTGSSMPIGVGNSTYAKTDTILLQNNLVVTDAPVNYFLRFPLFYFREYYREVDYNGYYEYGGLNSPFMNGNGFGAYDYATWQAFDDGNDASSITGNSTSVTFANKYGVTVEEYYTETGRDLGVNIGVAYPYLLERFPDIEYDILGNPRTGTWDMGALEFQGGQSNNISVKSKVFLQGPFNTNSMNTNLSQNSLLPNTQPFNTAPWNYNGSESLSSGSSSSFVDWVLVELRNSSNPTQVVSRKAAILKNDGTLLNSDGSTGVPFSNVQEGSYYVAVFHRNHLAIMSANPVQLSANSEIYDFTNGMDKAFGTNPMVNLGNGVFGMFAGDGNSNGGITIADRNEVWLPQNGTLGYLKGDFNIDGGVTIHDINLYWNINNGTMTQVP